MAEERFVGRLPTDGSSSLSTEGYSTPLLFSARVTFRCGEGAQARVEQRSPNGHKPFGLQAL
jgi:hypothetical protein